MSAAVNTSHQVSNSPRHPSVMASTHHKPSLIMAQKVQRLRINRVAIIQELRVEHVLLHLLQRKVVTQQDIQNIMAGRVPADRTRILIDLLPTKGRAVDWYGHFKDALANPDTDNMDQRKKYAILIDFLDNAIIPTPPPPKAHSDSHSKMKLPHYPAVPAIGGSGSPPGESAATDGGNQLENSDNENPQGSQDEVSGKPNSMLIKGFFHQWVPAPGNFASLLSEPTEHFRTLGESEMLADQQQLRDEKLALEKMRALEIMFVLSRRGQLPNGFELCMGSAVDDLLSTPNLYHLYVKYLHQLRTKHSMDFTSEIADSYVTFLKSLPDAQDNEVRGQCVKVGMNLFELMHQCGMFYKAELVLYGLVHYLASYQQVDTWMTTRDACIRITRCRNSNLNFHEADMVYNTIQEISHKLVSSTGGQLDDSQLYTEMSHMFREAGLVDQAHEWAQRSVADLDITNHTGVVDILCNASIVCSMKWSVKKAEELAIEAVRYAKEFFGTNQPQYVTALLHLSYYCSEFRQDGIGVDIARVAVSVSEKIYGGAPSLQTALAEQALATALVANQQFTDDEFYECAASAWRLATECMPAEHPRLAPFRYTLAQCLQWRASLCDEEGRLASLQWAETEAKAALQTFAGFWGPLSIKTAQGYSLLGQICARLGRWVDAQAMLEESYAVESFILEPNSNYIYLGKATLGTFYATLNRPAEAMQLLKDVVENVDSGSTYLKWVHLAYDTLISLLQSTGHTDQAQTYQASLTDWMKVNPKPSGSLAWSNLHAQPQPFDEFFKEFNPELASRRRVRLEVRRKQAEGEKAADLEEFGKLQEVEVRELMANLQMLKEKKPELTSSVPAEEQQEQGQNTAGEEQQQQQQQQQQSEPPVDDQPAPARSTSAMEREMRAASAEIRAKSERTRELERELKEIADRMANLQTNKAALRDQLKEIVAASEGQLEQDTSNDAATQNQAEEVGQASEDEQQQTGDFQNHSDEAQQQEDEIQQDDNMSSCQQNGDNTMQEKKCITQETTGDYPSKKPSSMTDPAKEKSSASIPQRALSQTSRDDTFNQVSDTEQELNGSGSKAQPQSASSVRNPEDEVLTDEQEDATRVSGLEVDDSGSVTKSPGCSAEAEQ